jgi:hypothetical protein
MCRWLRTSDACVSEIRVTPPMLTATRASPAVKRSRAAARRHLTPEARAGVSRPSTASSWMARARGPAPAPCATARHASAGSRVVVWGGLQPSRDGIQLDPERFNCDDMAARRRDKADIDSATRSSSATGYSRSSLTPCVARATKPTNPTALRRRRSARRPPFRFGRDRRVHPWRECFRFRVRLSRKSGSRA